MKLEIGDRVKYENGRNEDPTIREITEVRDTGYSWRYIFDGISHKDEFLSENSSDPFFDWGWTKLERNAHGTYD